MSIRRILVGATVAMMGIVANAQTSNNAFVQSFKANQISRPLGLNDARTLSDGALQRIGERVSANGFPTAAKATSLLKSAKAKSARMAKAKSNSIVTPMSAATYEASDTIFWESFEKWDGQTMPYIPTEPNNWVTKSAISDMTPYLTNGSCPTWTVYQGDGYYVPYATSGDLMLVCMYGEEIYGADGASVIAPAPQQDEWIVSPVINSIEGTNYLSFDICYSPYNTHSFVENDEPVFDMSRTSYDVEVLVTTSTRSASFDADKYTSVYKLSTEVDKEIAATDMNDDAAVGQLLYMRWHHIQIPLSEFDGENIRVAFRYTGSKGGSVLIDGIRVSDLLPVALFDRPEGSFYLGYSAESALLQAPVVLMPAYTPSVWTNYSNDDSKSFAWRYSVNGESGTSTERDLVMPASKPSDFVNWPTLQANSGLRADEYNGGPYAMVKAGGDAAMNLGEPVGVINFMLGNFNPTKLNWYAGIGTTGSAFGTGGEGFWAEMSDNFYRKVVGIANVFETPAAPYVFSQVVQSFDDYLNFGSPVVCTVYAVTELEDGGLQIEDKVIAQTTEVKVNPANGGGYTIVFDFGTPIVVDSPIAISIDGFDNDMVLSAKPLAQAFNHDSDKGFGFVLLRTANGGVSWVEVAGALNSLNTAGNMQMSFCMGMNATFPYIHSNSGDVFVVANDGDEKSFDLDTYWNPNGAGEGAFDPQWKVTCSEKWVNAKTVVDEENRKVSLVVEADMLPSNVDGRYATVTVEALACKETITVLQGSAITGIDGIANDDRFSNIDGTYTISGQRVNSADARHGLFIEKKNGKFVKVMK